MNGGVADPARNTPHPNVCYHFEFGRCRSNRIGVRNGSQEFLRRCENMCYGAKFSSPRTTKFQFSLKKLNQDGFVTSAGII